MFKKVLKYITYFMLFFIFICILMLFSPGPLEQPMLIEIKKGYTTLYVSEYLKKQGIIRNEIFLSFFMRIFRLDKKLITGEFAIDKHQNIMGIIYKITHNNSRYFRKITIPEGFTVKQIYAVLLNNALISGLMPKSMPEGSLMPDTYFFTRGETRIEIIDRMHKRMQEYLNKEWVNRSKGLPYKTKEDAIILASIVEKETANPEERFLIAGVFVNRLNMGMPLQSDPTVAYGLGIDNASTLTTKDLKIATPYNTYIKRGLPIAPIANPGRDSIFAVLHPAKTNYLYFVANGNGSHMFAVNLKDHNQNVQKWRKVENNQDQHH